MKQNSTMKCEYCIKDYEGLLSHQRQCKKKRESDDKALVAATTKNIEKKLKREFDCEIENIYEQMRSLERELKSKEEDEYIEMIYPKECEKCGSSY